MTGWQAYAGSSLALVFVHGLAAAPRACWSAPDGGFWPALLHADPRCLRPDIFLCHWSRDLLAREGGLQHCAQELFAQLSREDQEGRPGPLAWQRIVFVTQGAGALLVEHLLEWRHQAFRQTRLGLYRCTPPGSLPCPPPWRPLLRGLNPGLFADHCRTDVLWRDVALRVERLRAAGTLDLECLTVLPQVGPRLLPGSLFDSWRLPLKGPCDRPGTRHVAGSDPQSLARPADVGQPAHLGLLDFLLEHRFLQPPAADLRRYGSLFQRFQPRFESHYLERSADQELERLLRHYSVWIWGRPGVGKSVAALRALQRRQADFLRVSLSNCVDASPPELCRELLRALQDEDAPPASSLTFRQCLQVLLAQLKARARNSDFGLLIEDIPRGDERAFAAFSRYLLALLDELADSRCKVIVTSVQPPPNDWPTEQALRESFRRLEWPPWDEADLIRLATRIAVDTGLRPEDGLPPRGGSDPRQLKTRFRDKLLGLDPASLPSTASAQDR